ncbi:MAG: methyltransferase domain-containing protein [Candidatus Thorarchaeota archaeon]
MGCGRDIKKGYMNVDIADLAGVDVVCDLEVFPWPFKDNEFDEVYCSHILEHVKNLTRTLEEIHRICKPGAKIRILGPYFAGQGAYNDPTHTKFFTYRTFEYYRRGKYYSTANFITLRRKIFFFSTKRFMKSKFYSVPFDFFINSFPMIYQRFFCWIFPASEINYLLKVDK